MVLVGELGGEVGQRRGGAARGELGGDAQRERQPRAFGGQRGGGVRLGVGAGADEQAQERDRRLGGERRDFDAVRSLAGDQSGEGVAAGDQGQAAGRSGQQRAYLVHCGGIVQQ